MRNIDSVVIRKAIIHVLDRNADAPILTDFVQEIDEDIHEFLERHIVRSLGSDENRKGKFRSGNQVVKNACQSIFKDESSFIQVSKEIAEQLHRPMRKYSNIPSADLVVCLYENEFKQYIAILKLDYKKSFIHDIQFEEDKFKTSIKPQSISLPGATQQLLQCAFIKEIEEEHEYDLIILDKQGTLDEDSALYFSNAFLNCEVIIDNRDKTKTFREVTEKWTRRNLKEDFEKAMEVREEMNSTLKNAAMIDVEKFARNIFGADADQVQNLLTNLERVGVRNEKFEIDKKFVEKKMKKRAMKTDTGMEIKGDFEDFEDRMKFEIKRNGDGTVDLIVKNVRCISEK